MLMQIVQTKPTWEILAQPISTFCAGLAAVIGAGWLARIGFRRTLEVENEKVRKQAQLERQKAERARKEKQLDKIMGLYMESYGLIVDFFYDTVRYQTAQNVRNGWQRMQEGKLDGAAERMDPAMAGELEQLAAKEAQAMSDKLLTNPGKVPAKLYQIEFEDADGERIKLVRRVGHLYKGVREKWGIKDLNMGKAEIELSDLFDQIRQSVHLQRDSIDKVD